MADRLTLTDVEELARRRLDPHWWAFFSGGAGDERTLARNVEGWADYALRPRVLRGVEAASASVTLLGEPLAAPLLVAPMACLRRAHADGEEGMARAAACLGVGMCLSTFATATPAAVTEAAPALARSYQVYTFADRALTDELVGEALDAGFTSIVLTVDLPVVGSRDRELRAGWQMPGEGVPSTLRALERGVGAGGPALIDPALDWGYVEHLLSCFGAPVVVKGALTAEDAVLAVEHGAAGVVVSNHGGRQLDLTAATARVLPEVVEAVDGRIAVLVDGGIRRGADVLVALALGADAVLVGRTVLWGLVVGGEAGATEVLRLLREEIEVGLHLLGCATVAELRREHVTRIRP